MGAAADATSAAVCSWTGGNTLGHENEPGLALLELSPQLMFETMVINGRRLTELGLSSYYREKQSAGSQ